MIDKGAVIAEGAPDELKGKVGGERLEVTVVDRDELAETARLLGKVAVGEPIVDKEDRKVSATIESGHRRDRRRGRRAPREAGIAVADFSMRRPSLDDVFLSLTGHATSTPTEEKEIEA